MREIVLPVSKPALEWVNGRILQKVSPQRMHAIAQTEFASALSAWARAESLGDVGTEWEFRVQPPSEDRRPLVPDVAFLSYKSADFEDDNAVDIPRVAPDAAVEILSPGDLRRDVDEEIRVYLAAGTNTVFIVDTDEKTVTAHDAKGTRAFGPGDSVRHEALPGFEMPVRRLFH